MLSLLLLTLPMAVVKASIAWGSASGQTYQMTYDTKEYGTGPAGSLNFCQIWRKACIRYVGPLNYHHQVDCGASQKGPTIFNVCAAVQKDEQGNWTGTGGPCDFTKQVLASGYIDGVTLASGPSSGYSQCPAGSAPDSKGAPAESDDSGDDNDETPPSTTAAAATTSSTMPTAQAQTTTSTTSTTDAQTTTTTSSSDTATDLSLSSSSSSLDSDVLVITSTTFSSFVPSSVGAPPSITNPLANQAAAPESSDARSLQASLAIVFLALGTALL